MTLIAHADCELLLENTPVVSPPTASNTCAIIVTCCPDNHLEARLAAIFGQVREIAVIDNNSDGATVALLQKLSQQQRIHLIQNHENRGVATALNQGLAWALERAHTWALLLDQDTVVAPNIVASLAAVYQAFADGGRLAVIGSNYISSVNGKPAIDNQSGGSFCGEEVRTVITSGSLISLRVFGEIGNFRDEFFVDCVDLDYCLRARSKGYRVAISSKPLMEHSIGNLTGHRLPWKRTGTTNHPSWRQYFMARNTVVLAREYVGREPGWVIATLWSRMKSLLLICLFEKKRSRKIAYSLLGIVDGLCGRMNRSV